MPVYVLQFNTERTPWETRRKRFANWPPAKRIKWTGNVHMNMGSCCWRFAAVVRSQSRTMLCWLGVLAGVSVSWHSPSLGVLAGVGVSWHSPSHGVLAGVSVSWHSPSLGILAGVSVLWHSPSLGVLAGVSMLWHSSSQGRKTFCNFDTIHCVEICTVCAGDFHHRTSWERGREREPAEISTQQNFPGLNVSWELLFGCVFFVDLKNACKRLAGAKEQWSDVLCHFRVLMKNLLLGYFHTPDRNRLDAIHAIGSVLGFTQEDFHKVRNFSFSFFF